MSIVSRLTDRLGRDSLPTADCDPDTLFSVLGNERRRFVTRCVVETYDAEETFEFSDLTEFVAREQYDIEGRVTGQERKRVHVGLHQAHLSQLIDAGVLERVQGAGREFRRGQNAEALHAMLDAADAVTGGDGS